MNIDQQALHQNFKNAQRFLKRDLPWYLVIGPAGVGKSTLLANAELTFFAEDKLVYPTPSGVETTGHSNWWISESAVFIDVPGYYLSKPELWLELLRLVKRQKRLRGVIMVLSTAELVLQSRQKCDQIVQLMKQRIQDIAQHYKEPFSLSIILNKVDMLSGFEDFFDELSWEERTQSWGIRFDRTPGAQLLANFETEYDHLLKRLNERLIWRLHQEREIGRRIVTKDFPVQIESIKSLIASFLYPISEILRYQSNIGFQGIYLCSATQQGEEPMNCLLPLLSEHFELQVQGVPRKIGRRSQPYFIHQLLKETFLVSPLPSDEYPVLTPTKRRTRVVVYIIASIVVVLAGAISVYVYRQQALQLESAKQAIMQHHNIIQTTQADLSLILPVLNNLDKIKKQLGEDKVTWALMPQHQQKVHGTVGELYGKLLHEQLLPSLKRLLEIQLNNKKMNNPVYLYSTLKTYLMLGQPAHFQLAYIKQWLQRYQPALYPKIEPHLDRLFARSSALPLNTLLIGEARQNLEMMPEPMLAYAILQDEIPRRNIILESQGIEVKSVPVLYTKEYFEKIYRLMIPEIVKKMTHADWVLGEKQAIQKRKLEPLTQAVQELYIAEYRQHWKRFMESLKINTASAISLRALAEMIVTNTHFSELGSLFSDWEVLFNAHGKPTGQFEDILKHLTLVQEAAKKVTQSSDRAKAAREVMTADKIQTAQLIEEAKVLPQPMQNFVAKTARDAHTLIFQSTINTLQADWKQNVSAFYTNHIAGHYPVDKSSAKDISFENFTEFFGPKGRLHTYFMTQLKPLVDTNQAKWQWRSFDGKPLPFAEEVLLQLQRASVIQKMYFNRDGKLEVSFSMNGERMAWPNKDGWSWFRWVDKGTLEQTSDTRHFVLMQSEKKYEIVADNFINPFIAGIVDQFQCPEKL